MHNHVQENILNKNFRLPSWLAPAATVVMILNLLTFPSAANAVIVKPAPVTRRAHLSKSNLKILKLPRSMAFTSLLKNVPFGEYFLMPQTFKAYAGLKAFDLTRTKQAKNSRAFRANLGEALWVSSWTAKHISYAESRNNCRDVSHDKIHRGKWQMDPDFWATYGGLKFASSPEFATCQEQDQVAYNGWISRHWQPWQTYTLFSS